VNRVFIPSQSPGDWQRLLAKPDRHWKAGASAMAAASSWETATGIPAELKAMLDSGPAILCDLELLIAIPEWEVALPGGATASRTDVLAITRNELGLVILAVEAKVNEPFGPTLAEKRREASAGQETRLRYLHEALGLGQPLPDKIRYQLVHRAASALLTGRLFHARAAVMIVQSFSSDSRWYEDFAAFAAALGVSPTSGSVLTVPGVPSLPLYRAWCCGDPKHLAPVVQTAV